MESRRLTDEEFLEAFALLENKPEEEKEDDSAVFLAGFLLGASSQVILSAIRQRAAGALGRVRNMIASGRFGRGVSRVMSRVRTMWSNNIASTETMGRTLDRQDNWYMWRLGATEKHCRDCARLNGQIHRASEWRAAGIMPQSFQLECGGFNCDCRLVAMPGYIGQGEGRIDYWVEE